MNKEQKLLASALAHFDFDKAAEVAVLLGLKEGGEMEVKEELVNTAIYTLESAINEESGYCGCGYFEAQLQMYDVVELNFIPLNSYGGE